LRTALTVDAARNFSGGVDGFTTVGRVPLALARASVEPIGPKVQRRNETVADLDIVIPALNEERRIGKTIAAIADHVSGADFSVRLLVVDNGSVDATVDVINRIGPAGLTIKVISCGRRGKGIAVRTGVLHSSASLVAYCDADLSTPPEAITHGMDLLRGGWEAVIGSRRCEGSSYEVPQGIVRQVGSRAFNRAASTLVGPIRDTQCGFKLFEGDLARRVFSDLKLHGFAFDVELVARLIRAQVRMVEMPVRWSNDSESTLRPVVDGARAFRDLVHAHRAVSRDSAVA
jgi:dolichyl-phosphate beta-glucosyltransferase